MANSEDISEVDIDVVECDDSKRPPTVIERYFTQRFKINVKGNKCEDHCILSHSNRICIVTLAPSHPVVANKKTVTSVNFKVNENVDRLDNKVSGKSKREENAYWSPKEDLYSIDLKPLQGAQILKANSPLCIITCGDKSEYTVYSCVRGMLVEVNENLSTRPQLVVDKFQTEGYIAVVLPRLHEYDREMGSLLSMDDYTVKVTERLNDDTSVS